MDHHRQGKSRTCHMMDLNSNLYDFPITARVIVTPVNAYNGIRITRLKQQQICSRHTERSLYSLTTVDKKAIRSSPLSNLRNHMKNITQ